MALPSGYTKIDYIQSDGTQFIDTGFTPNQDTRFIVDFEVTSAEGSNGLCIIGSRTDYNSNNLSFVWDLASSWWMRNYGTLHTDKYTATSPVGRHSVDANKTSVTFDGASTTAASATFTCPGNLYLFAMNSAGTTTFFIKAKLYSCKIYDNGTLVRDFIPCINSSGAFGLWDDVSSVFYNSAGSGTFTGGKHHRTPINGTGYDIKSGRTLINGTGYDIKKGRTLIGGTGYDIKFGTPVGELDVGTSVYMNVDGTRREFIVVHQGNPDATKYDASCNGTWVWQKYVYETVDWEANSTREAACYDVSGVPDWLNSDYIGMIDSDISALIKEVKIPYQWRSKGGTWYHETLADGLTSKAFLPSLTELGISKIQYTNTPQDGTKLDYFTAVTEYPHAGDSSMVAHSSDGTAKPWFTRQSLEQTGLHADYFNGSGKFASISTSYYGTIITAGVLPIMIFPQEDAVVDSEFNIIPA